MKSYFLTLETENKMMAVASEIRQLTAEKLNTDFLSNFNEEKETNNIRQTFLNDILERNPFNNCVELISFSLKITELAVEQVLSSERNIVEKISLVSYIVELGAKEFISPFDTTIINRHLSSAKNKGYFFTPVSLAYSMVELLFDSREADKSIIDPACGVGTLLAVSLILNPELKLISGIEIDAFTANIAKKLLDEVAKTLNVSPEIVIKQDDFLEVASNKKNKEELIKYDTLIMNPPYGRVKFLKSTLNDITTKSNLSLEETNKLSERLRRDKIASAAQFREQFSEVGLGKGIPEYSKLFLGASPRFVKSNGKIVAITPSSWLGDESGQGLRKYLLENHKIENILHFREDAKLFNGVNQPISISSIIIDGGLGKVNIKPNLSSIDDLDIQENQVLNGERIKSISPKYFRIPNYAGKRIELLLKIHGSHPVYNNNDIINMRGELDLTQHKDLLTNNPKAARLIRGDHVTINGLKSPNESDKVGYVDSHIFKERIKNSKKLAHMRRERIVLPQCSYMQQDKRIESCIIPSDYVVANSCNYLLLKNNDNKEDLQVLNSIINSAVIEWRFRLFNSNNHIANFEINELPIIHIEKISSELKNEIVKSYINLNHHKLDALIFVLYNLGQEDINIILNDLNYDLESSDKIMFHYSKIHKKINSYNSVKNHNLPTLSKLDLEMIKHVPPGGNWMDIPETVPSKRLEQIRDMSKERGIVRTTYYGRLKPNQPAYTISTYFNRPGNGTNIHPWENRTISIREAARLQSFPDSFVFHGNDGSIRKQIGNAVPPLLSYAIGKSLGKQTFVDLFSGAGGLSYGLELAGLTCIAALEKDKHAVETFKYNHKSKANVIHGDITNEEVQAMLIQKIREELNGEKLGLIAGGPPCQGFSTAGWRKSDDKRNGLVSYFLRIAKELKPQNILIENVEGLLNYDKGNVLKSIQDVLRELGYTFYEQPWVLNAEEYGVPQMRRRVIMIASVSDELPSYPPPFFDKCKGRREKEEDKRNPILSYPITVAEALYRLPSISPIITDYYNIEEIDSSYSDWCKNNIRTEDFLRKRGVIDKEIHKGHSQLEFALD